jgi:hypothetical protein
MPDVRLATVAATAATASRAKLRVGLFADNALQPRWLVAALAKVAASESAELVLVSTGTAPPPPAPWPWRLYRRFDRKLLGSGPDLSARVDLRSGLPPVQHTTLPPRGETALWRDSVAALKLDVAFALGDVDDDLLDGLARYGTWRYRYGEELEREEAYAGAREVTRGEPVTASALVARPGGGAPERLLYQSWSRTRPLSIMRNRDNVQRKSVMFAARAVAHLHRLGTEWFEQCPALAQATHGSRALSSAPERRSFTGAPGSAELLRVMARVARRGVEKALTVDQWFIGYRFGPAGPLSGDLRPYRMLMPPQDRYWADPFPLERDGRYYIFFEEFMFATGKAHINAVEVRRDGSCSEPVKVLQRPYHLSYPLLVEDAGELYMIPESGANRTVEIYRCVRFPDEWRLEKVLLRGAPFVDATVHRAADAWWMFVNAGVDGAELHDELHIYTADSLLGEWRPHPANPVKSDVRSARPAGRLYESGGALYRPAQICAPLYGTGISVNRVVRLSPEEYVEREEQRILPAHPAGLLGLHTVNRAGELSVVDGFTRRLRRAGSNRAGRGCALEPDRLVPLHRTITEHADN